MDALVSEQLAEVQDGRLVACYRDTRLVKGQGEPSSLGQVIRLKKRRSFTTRLETPDRYDQSLVDGLVAGIAPPVPGSPRPPSDS